MVSNLLYYGDNLDILRRYIEDESVDLVYLDPPFNSNQNYNVIFDEKNGSQSASQIRAFEDTWHWNLEAQGEFQKIVDRSDKVSDVMQAFMDFLGTNDMMAYLVMMAPRLIELRRVLKPTGSVYLHCDPTASHYLKILMDAIFGIDNFLNDITWERFNFHADAHRWGRIHDVILLYSKDRENIQFQTQRRQYDEEYIKSHFKSDEEGRLFTTSDATAAGQGPPRMFFGKLIAPKEGTHWRWSQENIDRLIAEGRIVLTKKGRPRIIRYLDEMAGHPIGDVWTDIPEINSQARERLGYPTQKPQPLLERIIKASSNEGDLVLDPFCGCGTAISAAHLLNRRWIGIDITHLAITLVKTRLLDAFGNNLDFKVIGEPVGLEDAIELAKQDPYQFQWWALGLVGARPAEGKKGADKGIDGRILFFESPSDKKSKQIIISVKSGKVTSSHIRDLKGVVEREKAVIGVYISLNPPTKDMNEEAASAGFYKSIELDESTYPKIQILTIEDLINGKTIMSPKYSRNKNGNQTFKRAPQEIKEKAAPWTRQTTILPTTTLDKFT